MACALSADHFVIASRVRDETYVRVNGRRYYLWRAVDQRGQLIDFRLTARRNANAARAFMRQASESVRCYQPMTIVTNKTHSYAKVISSLTRTRSSLRNHASRQNRSMPDARAVFAPSFEAHMRGPKAGLM
ncbi:MAG: DDE-type integrase/transposase/recombinase [Pseudomonadota bacterium]